MASQFIFEAIGTHWQIDIQNDIDQNKEVKVLELIKKRIDIFDKDYSRFRNDSLVIAMSKKEGTYTVHGDAYLMISLYKKLYDISYGKITPLIGRTLEDAGYDAVYTLQQKKELEIPPLWEEVIEYAHPALTLKKPALLDFGAIGKGYLVDIVGQVLQQNNIDTFSIDAGGDILVKNSDVSAPPLTVGLEDPENFEQAIGVGHIKNESLCGSSGSRRKWQVEWNGKSKEFHHIIDPEILSSPRDILATWAVAESGLLADGLATALFFVEPDLLLQTYAFDFVILYADRSVKVSKDFKGELFITPHI